MHPPHRALVATTFAALSLVAAAPASHADEPFLPLPDKATTLTVPAAKAADCRTRLTGAGVATRTVTASAEGFLTTRLDAASGDWDLAVFDKRTGTRMGSSQAFRAGEVVQAWARAGQQFVVQACRRTGRSTTARLTTEYVVGAWPQAGPKVQVVEIPLTDTRRQVPQLQALGFDVEETVSARRAYANATSPAQLATLRAAGFLPKVVQDDLLDQIQDTLRSDRKKALSSRRVSLLPSGREEYRRFEDYQAELKKLAADNPTIVRPVTLPKKTFQGRDTIGIEVSGDVNRKDDQKPTSFIMGTHHAREWPAGEVVQELAYYLTSQYGKEARVTALLDSVRVVIVPLVNGDGFISSRDTPFDPADALGDPGGAPSLVEGALLPAGGTLAYRRKNCHGTDPSGALPCAAAYGVDPNRNYGFKWGGPGASTSLNSQSYRGEGQWSEPETQAVHEFSQSRDVTSLMTVHTIAGLVLRPPGLSVDGMAPDEPALKALGDAMAADTGYESQYSYQLYDTSGTTEDWNYGAAGTFGYTVELGPTEAGFHGDYQSNVVDQWTGTGAQSGRGMRSAFLRIAEAAADKAQFSTLAGRAPAGRTLRLKKTFKTFSSPVCTIAGPLDVRNDAYACVSTTDPVSQDDKLEYTTKVPATGRFDWLVTPSTPPFTKKKGGTEAWTLTCEDDAGTVLDTRTVTIDRNEAQTLDLPCGGGATGAAVPEVKLVTTSAAGQQALAAIKGGAPGSAAAAGGAADKLAPVSTFTKGKLRASRKAITLRGGSKDVAPKGLSPRLAGVSVSVGRRIGKQCQFLRADGTLGPQVSCLRTSYLPAKGTNPWTFAKKGSFPKGKYLAWVRGIDALRNTERKTKARNLVTFTIK